MPEVRFERVMAIMFGIITWLQSWLEKVEYEWATLLLGDHNSLLHRNFVFITCCWLFGLVRIVCHSHEHNMQQSALFYFFQLVSAMITSVLSALHVFYSHAFGNSAIHTYQTTRYLPLVFFYVVSLVQALMLLARCYLLRGMAEVRFERANAVLQGFIPWLQSWLEKVEYEWATLLLGDHNSLLHQDFVFITCCWLFGLVRIICRSHEHNMQQSAIFYFFQLVSAMTTGVLSVLHLFCSHTFGISAINTCQTTHHMPLHFFYAVSLAQALMLLACCYLLRG